MGCSSGYVESHPLLSALVSIVAFVYSYPYLSSPPLSFLSVPSFSFLEFPLFFQWNSIKKVRILHFLTVIFISNPPRLCLGTHQWCRALSTHPQNSMPQSQPNAARLLLSRGILGMMRSVFPSWKSEKTCIYFEIFFMYVFNSAIFM